MSAIKEYYRDRYVGLQPGAGPEAEPTFSRRMRAVLMVLGNQPARILDFGCNVGAAASVLATAGHRVVGVDISESAIRLARVRVPRAKFSVIDSEAALPFPDGSFDVCVCMEVIEHLFDVPGFVREVHRVLTRGGRLVLTTPYHGWVKNLLIITVGFERHFAPMGGHIRFFTRRSLAQCLQVGGFCLEHWSGIGRFWPLWKTMFAVARKV